MNKIIKMKQKNYKKIIKSINKMKKSISILTPMFSAHRMIVDYIYKAYSPAALFHDKWSINSEGKIIGYKKIKKQYIQDLKFLIKNNSKLIHSTSFGNINFIQN